jgi:hypothetical protein
LTQLSGIATRQDNKTAANANKDEDEDEVEVVANEVVNLQSPKRITRTATVQSGIPKAMSEDQKTEIKAMVNKWTSAHTGETFAAYRHQTCMEQNCTLADQIRPL